MDSNCIEYDFAENGINPISHWSLDEWDSAVVGICTVRALCIPYISVLWTEMKPILHFMPVFSVDLYQSLLALISVEVGFVPNYGWASESHLACVMISIFSSCCSRSMNKVNIFFFVQKWQPYTSRWPGGLVICFSHSFKSGRHLEVMSPFFFCCMFMSFADYYHRSGRHLHKKESSFCKENKTNIG